MSTNIMRKDIAHFLLTSTGPDVWSRIGDGIPDATPAANPEVTSETYIHETNATATLERYAPTLAITGKCKKGDAVFDFVNNLWKTKAVGSSAESYLLEVDLFATPSNTDNYAARKQKVVVAIDTPPGGAGGQVAQIGYTLHYVGDQTTGVYDVSAGTFT